MLAFQAFVGRRVSSVALRGRPGAPALLLLVLVASGCAHRVKSKGLPRGVDTGSTSAMETGVDSVRAIPIPVVAPSSPSGGTITIRERPVTADPLHGPPMYIVDGRTLGRRDDGTIDRSAAQRALGWIDPRTIASIQVFKGESAVGRFGPAASDGVVLIELVPHAWRAREGNP